MVSTRSRSSSRRSGGSTAAARPVPIVCSVVWKAAAAGPVVGDVLVRPPGVVQLGEQVGQQPDLVRDDVGVGPAEARQHQLEGEARGAADEVLVDGQAVRGEERLHPVGDRRRDLLVVVARRRWLDPRRRRAAARSGSAAAWPAAGPRPGGRRPAPRRGRRGPRADRRSRTRPARPAPAAAAARVPVTGSPGCVGASSNPRRSTDTDSGRSGRTTITCSSWASPARTRSSPRVSRTRSTATSPSGTVAGMLAPTCASCGTGWMSASAGSSGAACGAAGGPGSAASTPIQLTELRRQRLRRQLEPELRLRNQAHATLLGDDRGQHGIRRGPR